MAAAVVVEKTDLVKSLRRARDQVLKEWDISFGINGEILSNIMNFISDINTDVLVKFYNDKILIPLKSPDNIQYAEIEIGSSDLLDYVPNIEGDSARKDAKSLMKGSDGYFKGILIDMRGTKEEIEPFSQKDDLIVVRIDSYYYKRVEFHCPGNIVIWAQLMDPSAALKSVERLPDIIKGVRDNPNIKKASVIIEPATFSRICNIGGKSGKKRDIDERMFIELDKKAGLYITSGDKLRGRLFELRPTEIEIGQMGQMSVDSSDSIYADSIGEAMEEFMGADNMEEFGYAPGHDDGQKKDKRSPEKAPMHQLLGIEVDSTQYVYLSKEFIMPFTKLKGLSPIVIEVRTDKPVIIEQKPYNGIRAMLTIAPRIESEEDSVN